MTPEDTATRAGMPAPHPEGRGRKPREQGPGVSGVAAARGTSRPDAVSGLMDAVVNRENMWAAYRRVVSNKGAAGVDGMTVADLGEHLKVHWPAIKEDLLAGRYQPAAVRKVEIPKPNGGGMRLLGIPTVVDRLIQQALHQVLMPLFDPDFSESSFGFRPGRSAHQALMAARGHVAAGRRWVVDMDLEKFFDRVNHDVLMARVARRVDDTRVLALIGRYLRAGLMDGGVISQRTEGTPQGGPLSPLLSNVLLDDLDKELERRGHAFVRYADDCNIYVRSRAAGERVLASLTRFLSQRLRLTVNAAKSAVDRPWKRTFLGYTMTHHHAPRLKAAGPSVKRFKAALRDVFRRGRGRSIGRLIDDLTPKLRGWMAYFRLAQAKGVFEELDQWLRRKLRVVLWRQWKRPRTRAHKLMQRGLAPDRAWQSAMNGRGPWWNAGASHMNQAVPTSVFRSLGLIPLIDHWRRFQRSA